MEKINGKNIDEKRKIDENILKNDIENKDNGLISDAERVTMLARMASLFDIFV